MGAAVVGVMLAFFACDPGPRQGAPAAASIAPAASSVATVPPAATPSTSVSPARPADARKERLEIGAPAHVLAEPKKDAMQIGMLSPGDAPAVRGRELPGTPECRDGFQRLEAGGWICLTDAKRPGDPRFAAFTSLGAERRDGAYPLSYGESLGAPVYTRVPTDAEQQRSEPGFDQWRGLLTAARRALLLGKEEDVPGPLRGVDLVTPADPCPPALLDPSARTIALSSTLAKGAGVAWMGECDAGGRVFLITPSFGFVPRDRVASVAVSAFHGVEEPLDAQGRRAAFVTGKARPRYRMVRYGFFEVMDTLPVRAVVRLTGEHKTVGAYSYLETTDQGSYVLADHVAPIEPAPRPPEAGAAERWIDVSLGRGMLVAYQGDAPVFATLVGAPQKDGALTKAPLRIEWKARTRSLGEGGARLRMDLPYVQSSGETLFVHGDPYAAPQGSPPSGRSIRLSPHDAAWLFAFTSPPVPEGWTGRRGGVGGAPPGTLIRIRD
jgi:hypothetical protein